MQVSDIAIKCINEGEDDRPKKEIISMRKDSIHEKEPKK